MKSVQIIVEELKNQGVKDAEVVVVNMFDALAAAMPKIVVDAEVEPLEKTVAGVLAPVLMGFKPAVEKFADFNKDGKVG